MLVRVGRYTESIKGTSMKIFSKLILSLAAIANFSAVPARADTGKLFDMSLEELQNISIETVSKRPQKLSETPADTIVIRKEQIRARNYRHLADLLEDLPSVDVFKNISEESRTMVSIRGIAGNNKFIILKNGQRLNPPTGEELPVDFNYPLFDAERVEVIYGPASALYGADAFTGVINIVTADVSSSNGGEVGASYGTDRYRYGDFFAGRKLTDKLALEIAGHLQRSDNPDLSDAYSDTVVLDPVVDFSGMPVSGFTREDEYSNGTHSNSVDLRLKLEDRFTVGWNRRDFSQKSGNGQLPTTTIYGPNYRTNVNLFYGEYRAEISPSVKSRTNLSHMISEIDSESGYDNIFTNYERTFKYGINQISTIDQEFAWDVNDVHHLVGGVTASYTDALPQSPDLAFQADPSVALEDQGYKYPGTDLPMRFFNISSHGLGAYAQLQSAWQDDLSTTLGARFDNDSRYGDTFNPRAGIVYKTSEKGTAKLLYGESFRAPPTVSTYGNFGSFTGTDPLTGKPLAEFYHVPNPDLKPEKARTLELNYGHLVDPGTLLSFSMFSTWIEDLIDLNNFTFGRQEFGGGIIDGVIENSTNRGRAHFYGGNVALNVNKRLGPVGIDSFLNYSYTNGEITDDESKQKPSYLVPNKVKGGVTLRYSKFSVTPRFRYNSRSYLIREDTGMPETHRIASYVVYDLAVQLDDVFAKNVSLTLDIRNLLDKRYFSPGGFYSNNYINSPQDPLTAMLFVNYLW